MSSQQAVSISSEQAIDTFAHKLAHVIEYCILYLLFVFVFIDRRQDKKVLFGGILFVALYGISDEIHQSFVPTRGPRATDVLFDILGGLIGYIIVALNNKLKKH